MDDFILEAAIEYAQRGWRVVPIDSKTKHPPLKEWQKKATVDIAQIEAWWRKWPDANVGIQFGPTTGLIDIETDSPDAENNLLRQVFGGDVPPVTATFKSGSGRGKHRLFKYCDGLPAKANIPWGKIDFKLGVDDLGSQSLFPPSIHSSGGRYEWLVHPDDAGIADLPSTAIAFLWNLEGIGPEATSDRKTQEHWQRIVDGVAEGSRHSDILSIAGKMIYEWRDLQSADSVGTIMQTLRGISSNFKPPLPDTELQRVVVDLIKKERQRRIEADFREVSTPKTELAVSPVNNSKFHLVIIDGEPPLFELYAEEFCEAEGKCLRLNGRQLISGRDIRLQSLLQAKHALPATFTKAWGKKGGLYETLVATAERRSGNPTENRTAIVAQCVLSLLEGAKSSGDVDRPNPKGYPTKMQDQSVVFGVAWLRGELVYDPEKPTRSEAIAVIEKTGGEISRLRVDGKRPRMWQLSTAALRRLEELAWPVDRGPTYIEKKHETLPAEVPWTGGVSP